MFTNLIYKKFKQVDGDMVAYYPFGFCFHGMILKQSVAQNLEQRFTRRFNQLFKALTLISVMFIMNAFVKFLPDVIQNYMIEIMFLVVALGQGLHILFFFRAKRQSIKPIPFSYQKAEEYILHDMPFVPLVVIFLFFLMLFVTISSLKWYLGVDEITFVPLIIFLLITLIYGHQFFVVLKSRQVKKNKII